MNTVWIVPLEPIDTRYTKQWFETIPLVLTKQAMGSRTIRQIDVDSVSNKTTKGAFLDFADTNVYKARQTEFIADLFRKGEVKRGDEFLITDAWHFGIFAIRYMSELLDIPVEIHAIWHAGHYDPTDILGMKMSHLWPPEFERGIFHACDFNYFGTDFHRKMFMRNLDLSSKFYKKAVRSGQPHNMIVRDFSARKFVPKEDIVVWPHRINDDKQPDLAREIAKNLKYEMIFTQDHNLTKDEYYSLLMRAKAVFSCSLHENLGISMMEGVLASCLPLVPDRASYKEMYDAKFKYPELWANDYHGTKYVPQMVEFIEEHVDNYEKYAKRLASQRTLLIAKYLTADTMVKTMLGVSKNV